MPHSQVSTNLVSRGREMRKSTNMVNIKTFQTQTIGLVFEISEHLP